MNFNLLIGQQPTVAVNGHSKRTKRSAAVYGGDGYPLNELMFISRASTRRSAKASTPIH
jgi:hypothetical protein